MLRQHSPSRSSFLLLPLLVVLAIVALSCNNSPSTPMQPPGPGGGGTPVMSASVTATAGNIFSPRVVNLLVGGTVTFSNSGGEHNVNASGVTSFQCATSCAGVGARPSTDLWSFTITFPTAGTVGYVCDKHGSEGMNGQIVVQ